MTYDPCKLEIDGHHIRYVGLRRGVDESGHDMFAIGFQGKAETFGEFRRAYKSDDTHYDIEVVSLGYTNELQAPSEKRQHQFSRENELRARELIKALVARDANNKNNILEIHPEHFTGHIEYGSRWIQSIP